MGMAGPSGTLLGHLALLEIVAPSPAVRWFRIGAMIASGTWVLMLAWILYLSGWDVSDPLSASWTYLLFSWSTAIVAGFVLSVRLLTERDGARPLADG